MLCASIPHNNRSQGRWLVLRDVCQLAPVFGRSGGPDGRSRQTDERYHVEGFKIYDLIL
jgi:hypothetical protein